MRSFISLHYVNSLSPITSANVETYYVIQAPADESTEACLKKKSRSNKELQLGRINHIICAWQ